MASGHCPRCGKNATVTGRARGETDFAHLFQPEGIRWLEHFLRRFGRSTFVRLRERWRACLDCGLVWNSLHPDELRKVLEREGITDGGKEREPEID